MDEKVIKSRQERTDAELRYATVHLEEIDRIPRLWGAILIERIKSRFYFT